MEPISMKKIIIALGGNAIQNGENTALAQQMTIRETVHRLMPLLSGDYEVVITHGNGPQVGQLMIQQQVSDSDLTPALPLNTCVAMTQGMIGCWIQHEFTHVFAEMEIDKEAVSIVTQVEVDGADPAFQNPTKPVGPFYSAEDAARLAKENPDYVFKEDAGRGIRRVVASPTPRNILELSTINSLTKQGKLVVAAGGGGIPVAKIENELHLVDAVIDKDLASAKLAELMDADTLIILTGVNNVFVNFNKPDQRKLEEVSVDEMEQYIVEGHFAAGSMLPKVVACCMFLRNKPDGTAIISSLKNLPQVLNNRAGTIIHS
jgi:carbamate kinase